MSSLEVSTGHPWPSLARSTQREEAWKETVQLAAECLGDTSALGDASEETSKGGRGGGVHHCRLAGPVSGEHFFGDSDTSQQPDGMT